MMKHLQKKLKKSMGKGQAQTPVQVDNPTVSEPSPPPQLSRDGLNTSSGSIAVSDQPTASSSSPKAWLTVQRNVTKAMIEGISEQADNQADWVLAFTSNKNLTPANLTKWIIIVSEEYAEAIDNSIQNMMKYSWPNKHQILAFKIVKLNDKLILNYLRNIEHTLQDGKDFQMLFIMLSDNILGLDLYSSVKEHLKSFDFPAACVFANDVISKGIASIAPAKDMQLSREIPSSIKVPLRKLMVVGFDVYKAKGSSIITGAMVSTAGGSTFSVTFTHRSEEELSRNFNICIKKCCNYYMSKKGFLPGRIIIFRRVVESDHLGFIKMTELPQIQKTILLFYGANGIQIPKLSYIVVANKISSSMLAEVEYTGIVPPGTFLKKDGALPLRYHFFLISKMAQRVVKPTSFFVLHDMQGIMPEQNQLMIYKMCHFTFDSSGIVVLPIPCIFAYRLAFLMGNSRGKKAYDDSKHNLTFL